MKSLMFFVVGCFLLLPGRTHSQVSINEDPIIKKMMDTHIRNTKSTRELPGWRIQIVATTDRLEMNRVKENFSWRYPDIPINWVHEKPWYKLRAGAFPTRLEAIKVLHQLKFSYKDAYLAKDQNIAPEEFLNQIIIE